MSERDAEPSTLPGMEAELFPPPLPASPDVGSEVLPPRESAPDLSHDAATGSPSGAPQAVAEPAPPEPEPEFPKPLVAPAEKLSRNLHDPMQFMEKT